jgi:hypothetical protein
MEWGGFMGRKKKHGISEIASAHAKEQCEGVSSQFADMMCHYGMQGCLFVISPSGEQSVYCFSDDDSPKNTMSIIKQCAELTSDYRNIMLDKDETL